MVVGLHKVAGFSGKTVLEVVSSQVESMAAGRFKDLFLHKLFVRHSGHFFYDHGKQQVAKVGVFLRGPGLELQGAGHFLADQEFRRRGFGKAVFLHEPLGGEHDVSAAGGKAALVAQEMPHRHEVVIVVLDKAVVFVENAKRAKYGGLQKHFPLFLQPHDANGGQELGYGRQAQGGAGGHGGGRIGLSVPAGVEEGVVAHNSQGNALKRPETHKTVHYLVHGGEVGEVVDNGGVEVFHPVYGNGGFRCFRERGNGRLPGMTAQVQPAARHLEDHQGKDPVYEPSGSHLMRPARRPKSMM